MMTTQNIGIVTNFAEGIFQDAVITGIQDTCNENGYTVDIVTLESESQFQQRIENIEGLIIIANALPDRLTYQLHTSALPITLVSHNITGIPVPTIASNNRTGIRQIMHHIIGERERRKPVFIRGDMSQIDAQQRYETFKQELLRYNIAFDERYILNGDFIPTTAAEQMQQFIDRQLPFDAVIASDYLMALAVMNVLNTANITVPQEVSVIGFGDGEEAKKAKLSTIAADIVELGRRSARQLIGQIEGLSIQGSTLLATELIIRKTS